MRDRPDSEPGTRVRHDVRSSSGVDVARAGTRLPADHLTPERLRDTVREAIGCAEGAGRVAADFRAAGGASAAADAIEGRLIAGR